jgi:transcriptional regulator of nitric oxide reductase
MGASVEPKIMPGQSVFFRSFKWERFYLLYAKTVPELKEPVALFGRL